MEYKQLQVFLKVCEEKSITKAAERLFISQQAASRTIANLENELNAKLFVRTPQGVKQTDCGAELEQQAFDFMQYYENIVKRISAIKSGGVEEYKIGFFMGMLQELPPHFFPDFMDAHPEVQFRLQSYPDNERSRSFQNYDCDLVITTSPLSSGNFTRIFHYENPIGIMLQRSHPLAQKSTLTMADLKGQRLITINSDNRSQTGLMERLRECGLSAHSIMGDAEENLTLDLLRRGYVSFYAGKHSALPADIVGRPLSDLNLVWEFFIYKRRNKKLLSLERELIEKIRINISDCDMSPVK